MLENCRGKKKGVASFYVVAISTLILLVVVMSFATLVVSQLERSSNEDLSQSAYDAALAGIEDAKLAYMEYKSCIETGESKGSGGNCADIKNAIDNQKCNMVAEILKRGWEDNYGVMIKETSDDDNNLQQAYTCVKLDLNPDRQSSTVIGYKPTVFRPKFDSTDAGGISSIEVNWNGEEEIAVAIVQVPEGFDIMDFAVVDGAGENKGTDRGMVYLDPGCSHHSEGSCAIPDDSVQSEGSGKLVSVISGSQVAKSNNKVVENSPFNVNCRSEGEGCNVRIGLPKVYGSGNRKDLEVIVSKPSNTNLDVSVKYCSDGDVCSEGNVARITNQFTVDSTGRANDIFRRVFATIDAETNAISVMGPLEVVDGSGIK